MKTLLLTLLLTGFGMAVQAQISQIEYGWDTDKGHGLNTLVSVNKTGTGTGADVDLNIPMQGLTNGYHQLFVRTRDARGLWSHTYLRLVNVLAGSVPAKIVKVDYTYSQAGKQIGQYTYKLPAPATSVQLTVPGDLALLTAGQTYLLSIWATDENGTSSQVYLQSFTYRVVDCKGLAVTAPATGTFCKNGNKVLSATTSGGNSPVAFSWSRLGTEVGKTSSLTVVQAGTYAVKATDALGCVSTAFVEVSEAPSPTITMSPTTAAFCTGQSTVLTASASASTSPYSYQWKQGSATVGTSAATLTVNAGGTYSVSATDAAGCSSPIVSATVTQRSAPTATVTASAPGFTIGGSVTLTASESPGLSYQWLRDGQPVSGATQSAYTATQPGTYAATLSGSECSTTSSALAISLITAMEESLSGIDFEVSASPNPTPGIIEIRLKNQRIQPVSVMLIMHDLTGRSVYQQQIKLSNGSHTQRIDLSQYPAGLYLLNATTDQQQTSLRLVRE